MSQTKTPATLLSCLTGGLLSLTLAIMSPFTLAHHGTAVSYDQENWITVSGTVTEFRWRNPHSALFLDVKQEDGSMGSYAIELASPVLMSRSSGWTRATFRPGDEVTFRVHPSRTGAAVGECLFNCEVTVNGKKLVSSLEGQEVN